MVAESREAMANNLLMHVYPRRGGPWRDAINGIRQRLPLFDGRRVIGVVHGDGLEPADLVCEELRDIGTDFIVRPNDSGLREVATMRPGIEVIEREPGRTFYCHTKGATHDRGTVPQEWRDVMLSVCLDFPRLIDCVMESAKVCGPFRRFGGLGVEWHFSGSFFWFDNDSIWRRPWRYVQEAWYGVETFPPCNFHLPESACLFMDRCGDLYDATYWQTCVRPAFEAWQLRMKTCTQ